MSLPALSLSLACALFFAAMAHAAITDLRRRRIMNWTVVALVLGYLPLAFAAGLPGLTIATSVAAGLLVFFIGFASFCAGWVGGGDVKLAAAAAMWIGAALVVPFLVLATLFGALMCLLLVGVHQWQLRAGTARTVTLGEIPYGPGIVLAALMLFGQSQWFAGP